jgi:hypothetical protein
MLLEPGWQTLLTKLWAIACLLAKHHHHHDTATSAT